MAEFPVFISYAHIDDEPFPPDEAGWISEFHRALETRLRQVAGRDLKIWRDDRLAGSDRFWEEIRQRLDKSILISVLTPRYVQSESCLSELRTYAELRKEKSGGLRVRDRSPSATSMRSASCATISTRTAATSTCRSSRAMRRTAASITRSCCG